MKRLFIVFSVIISSFILFKEEVNAAEINITYEDYSLVTSDAFNLVYESAKETVEANNYLYYVILQFPTSLNYYVLYSNSSKPFFVDIKKETSSDNYYYVLSYFFKLREIYNSSGELTSSTPQATESSSYYRIASVEPAPYKSYYYLYSNFDVPFTYSYNDLILNYPHNTYIFNSNSDNEIFPSLYGDYLTYGDIEVPDIHKEEKETIASFYTICIDKIGYLTSQISNNYIYLSMITIFILIFVIELIRRYLM